MNHYEALHRPVNNIHEDERGIEMMLGRLRGVRRAGNGYLALCPCHDDHEPSLSVRQADDGHILLHCWAGCETKSVLAALGLVWADLFPSGRPRPRRRSR